MLMKLLQLVMSLHYLWSMVLHHNNLMSNTICDQFYKSGKITGVCKKKYYSEKEIL